MFRIFILSTIHVLYKNILKPVLFKIDAEKVHTAFTSIGEMLGKRSIVKNTFNLIFPVNDVLLKQTINDIEFNNPIGLSAGFDYDANLTQILPSIGFGFETVGTITNNPYNGNPRPMLGRLPKSKSLMVNKGFKNLGADKIIQNLNNLDFNLPIGVSIGRTNSKELVTQKESVDDICKAFIKFENSNIKVSYYELNISCPNLFGDISFYSPSNLEELLSEIDKLNIKKPVWVKMPIEKSNEEVLSMLEVISKHIPTGVIFGNLQKDRKDPSLVEEEVLRFSKGNFSGKPTYKRSNELINLAYKNYKDRFVIIGCGGVFNANDAFEKISLGASLVQLITGMIFEGPQLISQINRDLVKMIKEKGYSNISQAVGSA